MPHVSHQVRAVFRAAVALAMGSLAVTGCASPEEEVRLSQEPLRFSADDGYPRVHVYGNFSSLLPTFDATPAIDRFLYGPNSVGKAALRNPQGMTMGGGQLLVCDQGYQDIVAVDLNTGRSQPWCDPDHRPRCPVDISVGAGGRVYLADTTLRAVVVYDLRGSLIEKLVPGTGAGDHFRPSSLRIRDGVLYVGDLVGRCVARYQLSERRWLDSLTPPARQGRMIAPVGLAFSTNGTLLVADAVEGKVFRVNADGQWLEPIGRPGRGAGELVRPKQVACTPGGVVLVADAGRQSVLVFDQAGRFVTEIHEQARNWAGWTLPMGLLVVQPVELPTVDSLIAAGSAGRPSCYVIVSDSLGPDSLTLLGVTERSSKGAADGE